LNSGLESSITSTLLLEYELNPRMEISTFTSDRRTASTPGASARTSGSVSAPESRMSSRLITVTGEGDSSIVCGRRDGVLTVSLP